MDNLAQEVKRKYLRSLNNYPDSISEPGEVQEPLEDPELVSLGKALPSVPSSQRQSLNENQSNDDEWEKPLPFDETKMPAFDTSIFPPVVKKYVDALAEQLQTPVDMPAMAALNVLSASAFGKFFVCPIPGQDYEVPINLYEIYAMPPSSGKSPVCKQTSKYIKKYEEETRENVKHDVWKMENKMSALKAKLDNLDNEFKKAKDGEKQNEIIEQKNALREEYESLRKEAVIPQYIAGGDTTPEKAAILLQQNNERLTIISSEGDDLFSMISGRYTDKPNLNLYLKAWSGDSHISGRVAKGRDIDLKNPLLTIGLFVQNSVIRNSDESFRDRGMLQRFLYCVPESNLGHRKVRTKPLEKETDERFGQMITNLIKYEPSKPVRLALSAESVEMYYSMKEAIEHEMGNSDYTDGFIGWLGKMNEQIVRVAGILHIAECFNGDHMPETIEYDTFKRAASLYQYFKSHAAKAFNISEKSDNDNSDAKRLLSLIEKVFREKNSMVLSRRNDIQKGSNYFKNNGGNERLIKTESELEERSYIHIEIKGQKKLYALSPFIFNTRKKHEHHEQKGLSHRATRD